MRLSLFYIAFFLVVVAACKKKDNSIDASIYTAQMAGTRLWSGTYDFKFPPMTHDSLINAVDTPYTISQNGKSAVNAFGQVLTCTTVNTITKTVTFSYTDKNTNNFSPTLGQLIYYYQSNSMEYLFSSYHHDLGSTVHIHTN